MSYTRLNPVVVVTTHNFNNITIPGGGNYYIDLGSMTAVPGHIPVSAKYSMGNMSGNTSLVPSELQSNGETSEYSLFARLFNHASSSSTGSFWVKVYWMPA